MEKVLILLFFIFLGLVQGFTEPIPISSSGHLILIRELFNITHTNLSFEIAVHFGSLFAICYVYRHTIKKIMFNGIHYVMTRDEQYKTDFNFFIYLFIATCITGSVGLLLEPFISHTLAKPFYIGISLVITGLLLFIVQSINGDRGLDQLSIKDALIIGVAQSFALIPGISRSGITVITAVLIGHSRKTALTFSFLLFIPVTLGITVVSMNDMIYEIINTEYIIPYVLAFISSIIATYIGLKWFINVFINNRLIIFSVYCITLGVIVSIFM